MSQLGKIPPQSIELEEAILGAIMIENGAFVQVCDILSASSFYKNQHKEIFTAIISLFAKSSAIDILTVTAELRRLGKLEDVGGAYYITNLTNRVVSGANIVYHAKIVEQKFIQRELIRTCTQTLSNAYDDTCDVFDLVELHQGEIYDSVKTTYGRSHTHISDAVKSRMVEYEKKKDHGLTGIGTGYDELDRFTGGWQKSDLIIIAARPAMGKTALVLDTAKHAAIKYNEAVLIFSLEMSTPQLTDRLISSETGIYQDKIKKRELTEYDYSLMANNIGNLVNSKIYIDDTPGLSLQAMRSKAIRMKELYGIGLIVVDYLQLMDGMKDKNTNREQEIAKISRGLKIIAKELDVPVIALSQLSRAVENRPGINGKRPMLSDLRESGSIEQDADQVIFLYRPEYYGIDEDEQGRSTAGVCELIFGKNRNGTCDTVPLKFNGALMKFSDLEPAPALFQSINYYEPKEYLNFMTAQSSEEFNDDDIPF